LSFTEKQQIAVNFLERESKMRLEAQNAKKTTVNNTKIIKFIFLCIEKKVIYDIIIYVSGYYYQVELNNIRR
jgi:hypothetical protein